MSVPAPTRAALRRALLGWYDRARRDLPWRKPQGEADPYAAWIAEVMLQQTQVATAIPYYRRWLERFPTLASLAGAREEDVLAAWSGLGYYARARRLVPAAREALSRHGGLPRTVEALAALPGFGAYTAGAVASIAFGVRAPAVDGNAARVLSRLFLVTGDPAAPATRRRLAALAAELVPERRPGDFNQALMELGATICRKPVPACARCPLARACRARRAGRAAAIPPARRRPERRALAVAGAVEPDSPTVMLVRRPPGGLWGGLWDLPGCEVAPDENPAAALRRALRALGPGVRVGARIAGVDRLLTHRVLTYSAYHCRLPARASGGARRFDRREIGHLGIPAATLALLRSAGIADPDGGSARKEESGLTGEAKPL